MQRIATVFVLLATTACGAAGVSPTSQPGGDPQGSWQLVALESPEGPVPLLDDHPVTLTLEGSSVGGRAACNEYGGRIEGSGEGVTIADLAWTAMACMPDDVMGIEAAYLNALTGVRSVRLDGDELVLEGADLELRFSRLPDPPTAELVDTEWTLETLMVGDVAAAAAGEPATLLLRSDGTFTGSTGCRTFDGEWVERGEQLFATTFAMGDEVCSEELAAQDQQVTTVIGDGFVPSVEGDLLTLLDPGAAGLVYRAPQGAQ
jgi:heat shock protein HslJ